MLVGDWSQIKIKLQNKISEIFKDCTLNELSSYEKRKKVFEYLCSELSYDYDLLDKIKDSAKNKTKLSRNPYLELSSVIDHNKGICNAISQYYKLLLEQVGISCYCVICTAGTDVPHQLCLIYNEETGNYSFDDVTSVIVNRGTVGQFFDYDMETAREYNQGLEQIMDRGFWFLLPEDYINYVVGRKVSPNKKLTSLPDDIVSATFKKGI